MTKRELTLTIFLALFVSLVLYGCNDSSTSSNGDTSNGNPDNETLKIGVVGPFSGAGAGWGLPIQYGVEIAAKEVNDNGGIEIDGKTYNVEMIAYDDQYIGDEAVNAANRLVFEDNVDYIIGTIGSAGVLGMQTVTEQNDVLLMSNSYSTETISADKPLTFRVSPTNLEWGAEIVGYINDHYPDVKKVAFISPNDESGWEVQKTAEEDFNEYGGYEIVANEFPERNTQDYSPVLTKVLNEDPDIIAFGGTPPGEMAVAVKQARTLGYEGQFTSFAVANINEIISVTGAEGAEGFIYYNSADYGSAEIQEFYDTFAGDYNEEYLDMVPDWYDAADLLLHAVKEANTTDTLKVAETLRQIESYDGVSGNWKWTGEEDYGINQQLTKEVVVGEVIDGEPQVVDIREVE